MGNCLQLALLCFAIFLLCNAQETLSFFLAPSPTQEFNPTTYLPLSYYPETHTSLAPILSNFGYEELAMAVPFLYDPFSSSWAGPATVFAINDTAIRSCSHCSRLQILKERIIPGFFTYHHLSKLAHGTKIQTRSSDRCITVTSTNSTQNTAKILIDGVQITRPDLFNDGLLVIHGLDGFVFPLPPQSCFSPAKSPSWTENSTSTMTLTPENATDTRYMTPARGPKTFPAISMRLSIRDAMLRLRASGFSIVALALRAKYPELVGLRNMTIFALDDASIFSGGHSYVNNVRFHIVPNRYLKGSDLAQMNMGSSLRTLIQGQDLVVTNPGLGVDSLRINYVPVKGPDAVLNWRIVVHSIFVPFPRVGVPDWVVSNAFDHGLFHEVGSVSDEDVLFPEVERTARIAPEGHVAEREIVDEGL
ncbi:fasciclin-like arabinogalactan protein 21 [Amborella trichopoda]|uniref:FAS1 domain-containing protein n=1 Tax=Amborella trichopoda TaxID=13333 RepID=W1PUU1_AMBTC|nr:fasciclin-like arabinogalactan protein 21 [Amborella trichopoda]ERN11070.1 hypothetical protein AMTR_s00024p00119120 [Amborella trichopoda]|eukprot:XP_006849489.1 fasciclin-like arabinogalactan protein 21 [Amborella trichopoda]